jgi:thiosulfate dehydrogenase [quinone] large subunit
MLSEGIGKFRSHSWTAKGYLYGSTGPFSDLFKQLADNEMFLSFANVCVTYGLIFAGICLLLGLFTRLGCVIGIGLLCLFYVSMPPWGWVPQPGTESNYFLVNKNVVEALGLIVVLAFPTGRFIGLDAVLYPMFGKHLPTWMVGYPSKEA